MSTRAQRGTQLHAKSRAAAIRVQEGFTPPPYNGLTPRAPDCYTPAAWPVRAVSSVGERFLDTEEVTCSIHVPPTILKRCSAALFVWVRGNAFGPSPIGC